MENKISLEIGMYKKGVKANFKSTGGITLITLVITIILLIILAGVVINISLGENGIFRRAKEAKDMYINAQIAEEENINKISDELVNMEFGNTGESQNPTIKPGESGYEGGKYNAPYIPKGFKHIEGTWNTGYTIIGETSSVGNEFVWVPCVLTEEEKQEAQNNGDTVQIFQKITTGKYIVSGMTITGDTPEAEYIRTSVGNYGGFYIAKYEAGIPGITQSVITDHNTSTSGNILPVSKPNVGVWNFINRTDALSLSNKMINYEETGVHSTLISGAAWDTTLNWITNTVDNTYAEDSENKGNYSGTISQTSSNFSTAYLKNNIYDMAGNMSEWTTENGIYNGNNYLINRGGMFETNGTEMPAAYRNVYIDNGGYGISFRPVIYK